MSTTRIEGGIEWYTINRDGYDEEECQCARCGSSAGFARCCNCDEGWIEDDDWQDPGRLYRCDWCRGTGGSWHCISPPYYCKAHPLPGREHIESTAMRAEAWQDA